MPKRTGLILFFLSLAALFLILNRASYKGYFTDDDFDHLAWTRQAPLSEFVTGLLSPAFQKNNFRPAGHLFYHEEWKLFGFDFRKYLAATHFLHFLNVLLVWLIGRRLGAGRFAAAVGCAFFALHTGYFEAVWKSAYIFDVLCATFCLLSILCYIRQQWILSFVCFWLGYKSKELAVMMPFVLAAYELWYGQKRWKPLLPFFLASASFALQALVLHPNAGADNPYAFHFTVNALAVTSVFYAGRMLLVPYLGFVIPVAACFSRNRRIWFGTAAMLLFLTPVLFLPGRIETAYCYLPFAGLALAVTGAAEMCPPPIMVAALLLFLPAEIHDLRLQRSDKLAKDNDARAWVTTWAKYATHANPVKDFYWNGTPYGFGGFGVIGAIQCFYPGAHYQIHYYDKPPLPLGGDRSVVLTWNQGLHQLDVVEHTSETTDQPTIDANFVTPVWQLGEGWSNPEGGFRWIAPRATARLWRPEGAQAFEAKVLANAPLLQAASGVVTVAITLNGVELAPQRVTEPGWHVLHWDLPAVAPATVEVIVKTAPPFRPAGDPRTLGIALASIGYR